MSKRMNGMQPEVSLLEPTKPLTEPSQAEKQVEPIALDTVVKAYLEAQLAKLQHEVMHKEDELKKAEISMVAQMQRFMGQREGELEALKQQVASIAKQLNPNAVEAEVPVAA